MCKHKIRDAICKLKFAGISILIQREEGLAKALLFIPKREFFQNRFGN